MMDLTKHNHNDIVHLALRNTCDGIRAPLIGIWKGEWKSGWKDQVTSRFRNQDFISTDQDLSFLLKGVIHTWDDILRDHIRRNIKDLAGTLLEHRNRCHHFRTFDRKRTEKAINDSIAMLRAFKAPQESDVRDILNAFRLRFSYNATGADTTNGSVAPNRPPSGQPTSDGFSNDPLGLALRLAGRGWYVLPLKSDWGPSHVQGAIDSIASSEETAIRGWWTQHPKAKVGVALGKSGLIAILAQGREGATNLSEYLGASPGFGGSAIEYRLFGEMENTHVSIYELPEQMRAQPPRGGTIATKLTFRSGGDSIVVPPKFGSDR